jgi:glucokinase
MILGIDLGGTKIKLALVNGNEIQASTSIDAHSHKGFTANLERLTLEINKIREKNDIMGIGLATPGVVDPENLKILAINEKYSDLVGFNIKSWAEESFNLPFVLENDARAALYGEWQYGIGLNCKNVVGITLGTGIGSAAVVDGRMLIGNKFIAGNLGGHMVIDRNGIKCNCGKFGCMEAQSSTWSLPEIIKGHSKYKFSKLKEANLLDFKNLFTLANEGDECAREVKEYCLEMWSLGILNLCVAYDPEMVILNGGIMASHRDIIPYIEERINRKTKLSPEEKIQVKLAKNIDTAAHFGLKHLLEISLTKK